MNYIALIILALAVLNAATTVVALVFFVVQGLERMSEKDRESHSTICPRCGHECAELETGMQYGTIYECYRCTRRFPGTPKGGALNPQDCGSRLKSQETSQA